MFPKSGHGTIRRRRRSAKRRPQLVPPEQIAVRTEQTAAAPALAATGLGPAVFPGNILPPGFEGYVLRPDPPVRRTLTAYTRGEPDALAAAFAGILQS